MQPMLRGAASVKTNAKEQEGARNAVRVIETLLAAWRWQIVLHARALSYLLLLALGALGIAWAAHSLQRGSDLATIVWDSALAQSDQEILHPQGTPVSVTPEGAGRVQNAPSAERLVGSLVAIAKLAGVEMEQVDYQVVEATPERLAHYQFGVPLKGSYAAVQTFILAALKDNPQLALNTLRISRARINDAQVDARLGFSLYWEPS